ncbi:MAG: glutamine--fructose-6-phosphate transaminase (isomerizing) [Bacillota bacterium]
MCGIIGYIGQRRALPIVIEGLAKLEYRGYDSAGVTLYENGQLVTEKRVGRLSVLAEVVKGGEHPARLGVGHTRWATHGRPSDENAHPHTDCSGRFSVIHNGIIENFAELKEDLRKRGHEFISQTDTEVIPHLLEEAYQGDLVAAIRQVAAQLKGSFALVVVASDEPDKIVVVRKDSPLIIGLGEGENLVASDIPALLSHTRRIYILEDGEVATVTAHSVTVTDLEGRPVAKEVQEIKWDAVQAEKGGYPHFMLKEIYEQPKAIRDTLSGRIANGRARLDELEGEDLSNVERIHIVAMGTAYHAGLVGKWLIEKLARIPVEVELAAEFRYREPLVGRNAVILAISQSGETADTLAAMREGRRLGARVWAISNVVGSSVAREADHVIYTWAGPEIAVASTKAYTTQVVVLALLAACLAEERGTVRPEDLKAFLEDLKELPVKVNDVLAQDDKIAKIARDTIAKWEDVFFIGRGLDWAVAMEGQLKLKETSYIHAEAYAAGELKHGPLALITNRVPVIALITQPELYDKMVSNVTEVKARDALVIAVAYEDDNEIAQHVDEVYRIPRINPLLAVPLSVVPLQLLSYHAAVARGCDVDKPRNLAKSVTVE